MRLEKEFFQGKNIHISNNLLDAVEFIKRGKLVVAPTDTIFGILGDALNRETVERIYQIKNRTPTKPYIILIPDISYLNIFGIQPKKEEKKLLEHRGITVVFDLPESKIDKFQYLHRGTNSLAFRIPNDENLLEMLKEVGKPVVAPSANPEGKKPANNIQEAIKYFGNKIDLYVKGNKKSDKGSTIIKLENGRINLIREGTILLDTIKEIITGRNNK